MVKGYPNIELLVYKAEQLLASDTEFQEAWKKAKGECQYLPIELNVDVFPQVWGSTCTGFDVCPDGSPAISGCAMTKEYTTVVSENRTGFHVVFFGDRPCYKVSDAKDAFFEDMKDRNMAGLKMAMERY